MMRVDFDNIVSLGWGGKYISRTSPELYPKKLIFL